jgi:hypothetical protein
MAKDESHDDSLDFTEAKPGKPTAPATLRKPPPKGEPAAPAGSRKTFVSILAAIAVAGVIAFAMKEEAPPQSTPASSSAAPAPAPQSPAQGAPAQRAPQPYPPPVPTATPQSATPPKLESVRAMPADFLKAVREYNTKPAYRAIALALDNDGKWAYGTVSASATQQGANDEALSECERHKPKSGAQSGCRLFAAGDKVVW